MGRPTKTAVRGRKYRNTPTFVGMIRFDSKAEAKRYCELKLLAQGRAIDDLKRQVTFALYGRNGAPVSNYRCDFMYSENEKIVVEDVKGMETPEFKLKAKLFQDNYPEIDFRIVRV
jgi:hypothetical protein